MQSMHMQEERQCVVGHLRQTVHGAAGVRYILAVNLKCALSG